MLELKEHNEDVWRSSEIIDEAYYVDECVNYALNTGWVRQQDKSLLIEEYLKPIYKTYISVINEVKNEIDDEPDEQRILEKLTKRLNAILSRTQRIGSTEPGNIMRSIREYKQMFCRETYEEYAATTLEVKIWECLVNN